MTADTEVTPGPFGLVLLYVLRPKSTPPQPVDPTPELLEQAPWLLAQEDACPF